LTGRGTDPPDLRTENLEPLWDVIMNTGLDLSPPRSNFYDHAEHTLIVRATSDELDAIENALQKLTRGEFNTSHPLSPGPRPVTNNYPGTNTIRPHPNNLRQAIYRKVSDIRLQAVLFDNVPLDEVLGTLTAESRLRDPEGKGVNFILKPPDEPPPGM